MGDLPDEITEDLRRIYQMKLQRVYEGFTG